VVTAQNLLMKKLGLSGEGQLEAVDFEKYVKMFEDELSKRQVQLILQLIKCDDIRAVLAEPQEVE
jgi:hypothetical protein